MNNFKDKDRIKALRERLYDRGKVPEKHKTYTLEDNPEDVRTSWKNPPSVVRNSPVQKEVMTEKISETQQEVLSVGMKQKTHKYRIKIFLTAIVFFILAVAASGSLLFFGGNNISGNNINISINGPFTIGGGEVIPLQIGVTNQNSVPIESATLIVKYPSGTQSVSEPGKELFVERLPLDIIKSGEIFNISLRAVIFGEENEEKIITAEIEYRVEGSNSTFGKKAEPLRFKIGSSPVVMSVNALEKVSSGQETNIELTITSNSPTTLTNILVKAEYPTGFDYSSAKPEPVSGQDVWRIETLEPEGEAKIIIKGILVGKETDKYVMHFSTGLSNEQDRLSLTSVFSTALTEFVIEQPFIDVTLDINNSNSEVVTAESGEVIRVSTIISNTLEDTIYDSNVELSLSGNALSDYTVDTGLGFYDSTKNTVFWDSNTMESLKEMAPGKRVSLSVSLIPNPDIETTPQLAFNANVRARRISENNVTEKLFGTAKGVVKVSSIVVLMSETGRGSSIFKETGPIPPVSEKNTTYTLTLFMQNGSNDMEDVEVTASLPRYVTWLEKTTGAGKITFNSSKRTITWKVGDIDANQSKITAFQVSLLPSTPQIGLMPTLLGEQRLRGVDKFTGAVVRANKVAITTSLSEEAGYNSRDSIIVDGASSN